MQEINTKRFILHYKFYHKRFTILDYGGAPKAILNISFSRCGYKEHFKCINRVEQLWFVRITQGYLAIGILGGETVTWFWIGNHDEYERHFS